MPCLPELTLKTSQVLHYIQLIFIPSPLVIVTDLTEKLWKNSNVTMQIVKQVRLLKMCVMSKKVKVGFFFFFIIFFFFYKNGSKGPSIKPELIMQCKIQILQHSLMQQLTTITTKATKYKNYNVIHHQFWEATCFW